MARGHFEGSLRGIFLPHAHLTSFSFGREMPKCGEVPRAENVKLKPDGAYHENRTVTAGTHMLS